MDAKLPPRGFFAVQLLKSFSRVVLLMLDLHVVWEISRQGLVGGFRGVGGCGVAGWGVAGCGGTVVPATPGGGSGCGGLTRTTEVVEVDP
jgi:hypothetical protein